MRRVKVGAIIVVEDKVAVLQRQVDDKVYFDKEFLIQDLDGYLLRFVSE